MLSATLDHFNPRQAEKFIQEVFWRGYFKGWLEHRPAVWTYYKSDLIALVDRLDKDAALAREYDAAISGQTGIACFDAWASELVATGYLHNHARMWFASIWIFTLQLPWQLGADFFYRHLLDGDPASNTCSWRWVAGLHTVGKTYLARADNIEKFTAGRFAPQGQLARTANALEDPRPVSVTAPKYVNPDLAGRRVGLLVTEEDGHPESLAPLRPDAVVVLTGHTPRSVLPLGEASAIFAPEALRHRAQSFDTHFGVDVSVQNEGEWSDILSEWMATNELEVCVTSRLPIGPVARRTKRACREAGIELLEITRAYDQCTWPHAKRGFFGLKKKIPQILSEIGLETTDARPATLI
ncbi:MAG: FAD-binding domain-containing protein [Pseudomonadota bacterium]